MEQDLINVSATSKFKRLVPKVAECSIHFSVFKICDHPPSTWHSNGLVIHTSSLFPWVLEYSYTIVFAGSVLFVKRSVFLCLLLCFRCSRFFSAGNGVLKNIYPICPRKPVTASKHEHSAL